MRQYTYIYNINHMFVLLVRIHCVSKNLDLDQTREIRP